MTNEEILCNCITRAYREWKLNNPIILDATEKCMFLTKYVPDGVYKLIFSIFFKNEKSFLNFEWIQNKEFLEALLKSIIRDDEPPMYYLSITSANVSDTFLRPEVFFRLSKCLKTNILCTRLNEFILGNIRDNFTEEQLWQLFEENNIMLSTIAMVVSVKFQERMRFDSKMKNRVQFLFKNEDFLFQLARNLSIFLFTEHWMKLSIFHSILAEMELSLEDYKYLDLVFEAEEDV